MEPDREEFPSAGWRLTAPESYVLQLPDPLSSVEAFKLALRELVLRRALRLEQLETAGLFRRRPKSVLHAGTESAVAEPALAPLVAVHARAPERRGTDGVLVEDFAREARREFSRSFAGYVNDHVYPMLAERGLMRVEEQRRLGVVARRVHVRTPAGEEAAAELEEWLRVGRERVEDWSRSDPQRALGYAGGAGAAILLMRDLYPEFDRLGKHALVQGELAHGPYADFSAFHGFDSGVDSGIDAGIDAGGGWGGDGGGGGGDGGGGGN
jgi:hypothetical protein